MQRAEDAFREQNIARNVAMRISDFHSLRTIIGESDFISTVPRPVGGVLAKGSNLRVLEHPIQLPTYLVRQFWHERFHLEPGNVWLRQKVASIMHPNARLV